MHKSSMLRMGWFVKNYVKGGENKKVLDVGSYNVNGCYKSLFADIDIGYVGLDIEKGPNVDVVMDEIYSWDSIEDESFDYIISGQAFEHIEYPWLTIKEIYKKLKPGGIICLIAPNSLHEHKYPKDCYRYFGDGFCALAKWAGFEVLDVSVGGIPERSVSSEWDDPSNDVCLIAYKPSQKEIIVQNKLSFERRFMPANDIMMQYTFLAQWIELEDKGELIKEYLRFCNCSRICIYGYEYVGENLAKVLKQETNLEFEIISTKEKNVSMETGAGIIPVPGIELLNKEDASKCDGKDLLVIITIFDHNRDYLYYIDSLYPESKKCYLYDIVEFMHFMKIFKSHLPVYLYGAGNYGKNICNRIREFGFTVSGFIVSDGRKTVGSYCDIPVHELSEIGKDSEIIISVGKELEKEIKDSLMQSGYKNVYDGRAGINTWQYSKQI
ncbi:MAG: methyltransferase domain-containing protein [Lachnospiraceae bacterium]